MDYNNEKPVFKNKREKIQWYLDEIDSYKEDMGKWYTVLIRRILPFLIFIIPLNIISMRVYSFTADKFLGGILDSSDRTLGLVLWLVSMIFFLVILIFLPRFGTFCEFVIGPMYIILAFKAGLMKSGLGYFVIITVSIFMFMKLVFLVLEIMYQIVFHDEKTHRNIQSDDDVVF
jgi:hypothetical protein